MLSFKSKFAVGKPIVRPNCSPFMTVPESSVGMLDNLLQVVYRDGKLLNEIDFEEVRVNSGKTIAEVGKNIMIKVSAP